jgi:hypothetical protein
MTAVDPDPRARDAWIREAQAPGIPMNAAA